MLAGSQKSQPAQVVAGRRVLTPAPREQKGCATCHSVDGTKGQGPTWKGIYGTMVEMNDGKSYLVDDAYLQESMLQPNAKVVKGFEPIMPSFQGLLHPQDVRGLIAYIKTLK